MKNKKNNTQKLVKHIANKHYIKANEVLEAIIKDKINQRVEEVLAQQDTK